VSSDLRVYPEFRIPRAVHHDRPDRLRGGLFLAVPGPPHPAFPVHAEPGNHRRCLYPRQVITSVLIAVFVFILLRVCGVSSALAIALFAGVADVLPYIGAVFSVERHGAALSRGPTIVIVVSC